MVRYLAVMAFLSALSGCSVKFVGSPPTNYDYTDYATYDQPQGDLGVDPSSDEAASSLPDSR